MTGTVAFRTAIRDALDEELAADERVILFGEDVAVAGGVFATTTGLYDKYGPERVFDTPISELALAGAAFGSAVHGLRPVIEIMFGDFLTLAMDSLVNQSTKYWFLTQEQVSVPLVDPLGRRGRRPVRRDPLADAGVVVHGRPGPQDRRARRTPADAKALLKAAIRDDNPVLFFEHKRLYALEGEVDGAPGRLGEAAVVREGRDVTLVTAMKGVHDGLEAADELEADGVSVEVIDLRTLRPFDLDTVLASVRKTNRIVVVEEGPLTGGWAGEVLASVVEHGLGHLDDAWRIATPDTPDPLQPAARGRVPAGPGADRTRRFAPAATAARMRALAVSDRLRRPSLERGLEASKVGHRLRAERERLGIGLRELARRVGVSPSLVSQIELDRVNPSVSTLYAIVTELGMTMSDVFGEQPRGARRTQRGDGLAETPRDATA